MKIKAYAYIDIKNGSSDSIEHQKKVIKEYCDKRQIMDIEYFNVTRNKSVRDSDAYKIMLEMMSEDKGSERIFVALDLSKVTRNLEEWIKIEEDLKRLGVKCHMTANGPIALSPEGFHMLQCNS
ncbi:recombinase family protein [Lacrimispora indolis]|uniref:recombinase family protein n=1 Tax=Lacrimispora indolis TaxID=69825 RepID=UPI000462AB03|nr:recombinase family protein [[Clostridium] methoxybenzovorans]